MRITRLVAPLALALGACGGARSPAQEPVGTTETTGVAVDVGPASPGDPTGITTERGVSVSSGAVASPMEGSCPSGEPSPAARDLEACVASCRGMNDQVPLGSRCTSRYASCTSRCGERFRPTP